MLHICVIFILFPKEFEYGSEKTEAKSKPTKERLTEFNVQSINQQPLHRGGRSNPNQ